MKVLQNMCSNDINYIKYSDSHSVCVTFIQSYEIALRIKFITYSIHVLKKVINVKKLGKFRY